ncbi:MAG: YceD family protein [Pikeienuella sp.]
MDELSPPFSVPVPLAEIRGAKTKTIVGKAETAEADLLATWLDLRKLRELSFKAKITPIGRDKWRVSVDCVADITQNCVLTLAPVETRINDSFVRMYTEGSQYCSDLDLDFDPTADDPPDPVNETIDIGHAIAESLLLALDPYPRLKGAEFAAINTAPPGIAPIQDAELKPFAGLASLKKAMDDPK